MIPPFIRVREKLSSEQRKSLIEKFEASELFTTSPCKIWFIPIGLYVHTKEIKKEFSKYPIGFICRNFIGNYADRVSLDIEFPWKYNSEFIRICDSKLVKDS